MADSILVQMDPADPFVDGARRDLCLQSVFEIDKIARSLPGLVPLTEGQETLLVKALAGRMLRLTSALMGALSDTQMSDEQIRSIVDFDQVNISQG